MFKMILDAGCWILDEKIYPAALQAKMVAVDGINNTCMTTEGETMSDLLSSLKQYIAQRILEFDEIPSIRKEELKQLAGFVQRQLQSHQAAELIFICTHNSRRSHLSQIWAQAAA
ncbi:MAG: hypothetical protein KDH97_18790, partial [Calditrichaeota bacterium]|nr:hypothetical protein [Calditrichota bacterium]